MNPVEQTRLKAANLIAETQRLFSERADPASITRRRLEIVDAITDHMLEVLKTRFVLWVAPKEVSPR